MAEGSVQTTLIYESSQCILLLLTLKIVQANMTWIGHTPRRARNRTSDRTARSAQQLRWEDHWHGLDVAHPSAAHSEMAAGTGVIIITTGRFRQIRLIVTLRITFGSENDGDSQGRKEE